MRITIQDFGNLTAGLSSGSTKGGGVPQYTPAGAPNTLSYESAGVTSQSDLANSLTNAFKSVGKTVNDAKKEADNLAFVELKSEWGEYLVGEIIDAPKWFQEFTTTDMADPTTKLTQKAEDTVAAFEESEVGAALLKNPDAKQRWEALRASAVKDIITHLSSGFEAELRARVDVAKRQEIRLLGQALPDILGDSAAQLKVRKEFGKSLKPYGVSNTQADYLFDVALSDAEILDLKTKIIHPETRRKLGASYTELVKKYPNAARFNAPALRLAFEKYGDLNEKELQNYAQFAAQERIKLNPGFILNSKDHPGFLASLKTKEDKKEYGELTELGYRKLRVEATTIQKGMSAKVDAQDIREMRDQLEQLVSTALHDTESTETIETIFASHPHLEKHRVKLLTPTGGKQWDAHFSVKRLFNSQIIALLEDPDRSLIEIRATAESFSYDNHIKESHPDADPAVVKSMHGGILTQIDSNIAAYTSDPGGYSLALAKRLGDDAAINIDWADPVSVALAINEYDQILSGKKESDVYFSKDQIEAIKNRRSAIMEGRDKDDEGNTKGERIYELMQFVEEQYKKESFLARKLLYERGLFTDAEITAGITGNIRDLEAAALIADSQEPPKGSGNEFSKKLINEDLKNIEDEDRNKWTRERINNERLRQSKKEFEVEGGLFALGLDLDLEDALQTFQDEGVITPTEDIGLATGTERGPGMEDGGMIYWPPEVRNTIREGLTDTIASEVISQGASTTTEVRRITRDVIKRFTAKFHMVPQLSGNAVMIPKEHIVKYSGPGQAKYLGEVNRPIELSSSLHQVVLNGIAEGKYTISPDTVPEIKGMPEEERERLLEKYGAKVDKNTGLLLGTGSIWKNLFQKNLMLLEDETRLEAVYEDGGNYRVYLSTTEEPRGRFPTTFTFTQANVNTQIIRHRIHLLLGGASTGTSATQNRIPTAGIGTVVWGADTKEKKVSEWMSNLKDAESLGWSANEIKTLDALEVRLAIGLTNEKTGADGDPVVELSDILGSLNKIQKETEPHKVLMFGAALYNISPFHNVRNKGAKTSFAPGTQAW